MNGKIKISCMLENDKVERSRDCHCLRKQEDLDLVEADFKILHNERISGHDFLKLQKKSLNVMNRRYELQKENLVTLKSAELARPKYSVSPIHTETKSEEKEIDDFRDSIYKERVRNEIIQSIKEKKLRDQNLSPDISSSGEVVPEISVPSTSISKFRKSEISAGAPLPKNSHRKKGQKDINVLQRSQISSTVPLLSLAQLFNRATDAEYSAIRANQEEILCWYYYGKEFVTQVNETIKNSKVGEKKAKGIIYDKMLEDLNILRKKRSEEVAALQLPEISRKYLQGKIQKAVKIYKLFENLGIDRIKYITTYSANSISELTNDKIQEIIDNFIEQVPKVQGDESSIPETSTPSISLFNTSNSEDESLLISTESSHESDTCGLVTTFNLEDIISEDNKSLPETEASPLDETLDSDLDENDGNENFSGQWYHSGALCKADNEEEDKYNFSEPFFDDDEDTGYYFELSSGGKIKIRNI
ncbi:hypothetical protein Glove_242g98 [Diversispora epigaea]|uniref:Uncharacterized protein n=1 Tax=Diversispora epigaea TaxID=1348612 RepID=A0A397IGM7_9GLOM|nr:hypothetical protein Glove_242g98 [Diversispora epigaea]